MADAIHLRRELGRAGAFQCERALARIIHLKWCPLGAAIRAGRTCPSVPRVLAPLCDPLPRRLARRSLARLEREPLSRVWPSEEPLPLPQLLQRLPFAACVAALQARAQTERQFRRR